MDGLFTQLGLHWGDTGPGDSKCVRDKHGARNPTALPSPSPGLHFPKSSRLHRSKKSGSRIFSWPVSKDEWSCSKHVRMGSKGMKSCQPSWCEEQVTHLTGPSWLRRTKRMAVIKGRKLDYKYQSFNITWEMCGRKDGLRQVFHQTL